MPIRIDPPKAHTSKLVATGTLIAVLLVVQFCPCRKGV
jgi:hypothetical protein